MAKQNKPVSDQVPDTARTYERAKPEGESVDGSLSEHRNTPQKQPDQMKDGVKNRSQNRQLNSDDIGEGKGNARSKKK